MGVKRPYAPMYATMNGVVAAIHCKTGDRVELGEPVVTLEAMKLYLEMEAEMAGEVEIVVAMNDAVSEGQLLAKIYPN